jgi:hypothetical protein
MAVGLLILGYPIYAAVKYADGRPVQERVRKKFENCQAMVMARCTLG